MVMLLRPVLPKFDVETAALVARSGYLSHLVARDAPPIHSQLIAANAMYSGAIGKFNHLYRPENLESTFQI